MKDNEKLFSGNKRVSALLVTLILGSWAFSFAYGNMVRTDIYAHVLTVKADSVQRNEELRTFLCRELDHLKAQITALDMKIDRLNRKGRRVGGEGGG